MEKRVTLAVVLCVIFALVWMSVWNRLFPPPPALPPAPQQTTKTERPVTEPPQPAEPKPAQPVDSRPARHEPIRAESEERVTKDTDVYQAVFSNRGASLRSLKLKKFVPAAGQSVEDPAHWLELLREYEPKKPSLAFLDLMGNEDLSAVLWKPVPADAVAGVQRFAYEYSSGSGLVYTKTFELAGGRYDIRLRVEVSNPDDPDAAGKPRKFTVVGPSGILSEGADVGYPPTAVFGFEDDKQALTYQKHSVADFAKETKRSVPSSSGRLLWTALMNKYFAAVLAPATPDKLPVPISSLEAERLSEEAVTGKPAFDTAATEIDARLSFLPDVPAVGRSITLDLILFAGEKDELQKKPEYASFAAVRNVILSGFCFLDFIVLPLSDGLLFLLRAIHVVVRNWGVAIILLTFLVKLVMFPFTSKMAVSMNKQQQLMAKYKPELDRIREKHKNNKQKLSEETMKFYKEKKLNIFPLGGCLPLLVTMPVFMGLFYILNSTIDLRQAPFVGWINDLARPDELMTFESSLPIPCFTIKSLNLLPILMALAWFWQAWSAPKPADPQAAQSAKMQMIMPFLMMFVLYNYAAGLSLYWITNSVLGIIEQRIIRAKYLPKTT